MLKIKLGHSETFVSDTKDMINSCRRLDLTTIKIHDGVITTIVTSPPYSAALDYIKK